jgi:hypothetical protein
MSRPLSTIAIAAVLGSLTGTALLETYEGGVGSAYEARLAIGFTMDTLFFTLPGAAMVHAVYARLRNDAPVAPVDAIMALALGTLVGTLVLGLIINFDAAPLGAVYGFTTSAAVLLIHLLRARRIFRRK